jgi:hypothetical protein
MTWKSHRSLRYDSVVIRRLLISAIVVLCSTGVLSQDPKPRPPQCLFRAVEQESTLHPTAGPNNFSNCIVVQPNGRFHLLLRRQEITDGTQTASSFEGLLDEKEMQTLRNLLDDDAVKQLPPFVAPEIPLPSDTFQAFIAEVSRVANVQQVGHFSWKGDGPRNPESVKKDWQNSEVTLQTLVEWFHAFKSFKNPIKRRVSSSESTIVVSRMCDITP